MSADSSALMQIPSHLNIRQRVFRPTENANRIKQDELLVGTPISSRHFAFLVSEQEFDAIFERIKERDIIYWADPFRNQPDRNNRWDDGRGLYFDDPNGHLLEIITRPYGSGGCDAKHPNPLLECP
jgi:hypothetical protein